MPATRPRLPVAVVLLVLLAALAAGAAVAGSAVEDRIADDEAAAIRAAIRTQAPAIARLQDGQVFTGSRALIPIAEGARARSGGTVRLAGRGGVLLLQTDSFTRTDTTREVAAALDSRRAQTRVIGPAGGRQRITAVPFRSPGGDLVVVAMTTARHERAAAAARSAIRLGAAAGLALGAALTLASAAYFRRKALMRSPNRS